MPVGPHFSRLAKTIFAILGLLVLSASPAAAAEALPKYSETLFKVFGLPITNSMVMVWLVAAVIILVARAATSNMQLVPTGLQNFVEWMVESLINFFAGILGEPLARRTFWFFGTVFIFILFANWIGLFPGVGTIGWGLSGEGVVEWDRFKPFLRGANADVHLTLGMSLAFTVLWLYWCITEIGVKNFFAHIFAPKGDFKGVAWVGMLVLFAFVGLIEVLSIALRPVALTFRLYGNIYAGENMLETLSVMLDKWYLAWLPAFPFYFLKLLVGFVQALVFALLTSVFLKLMTDHDDHDHDEHHGHDDDHAEEDKAAA